MKPKQAKAAAEAVWRNLRVRLEYGDLELQRLIARLQRTNENLRSSQQAILRTNSLLQPVMKRG